MTQPIEILIQAFNRVADSQNDTVPTGRTDKNGDVIRQRVWPTVEGNLAVSTTLVHAVEYLREQA